MIEIGNNLTEVLKILIVSIVICVLLIGIFKNNK